MTYKEFYTEATKGIDFKTVDKATMEFAYIMFYQQFNEETKESFTIKFIFKYTINKQGDNDGRIPTLSPFLKQTDMSYIEREYDRYLESLQQKQRVFCMWCRM